MGLEIPDMNENDRDTLKGILQGLGIACENVLSDRDISDGAKANFWRNQRLDDTTCSAAHDQTNTTNPETSAPGGDNNHSENVLPSLYEHPVGQIPAENLSGNAVLMDYDSTIDNIQNDTGPSQLSESYRMHGVAPTQLPPNNYAIPSEDLETDSEDEVTNQFACRLGRVQLTHDSQLRYFGSTSHLNLLDVSIDVGHSTPPLIQKDAQEILENLDLNLEVEEGFEKHLLDLYFAWQDPCVHVIHSEAFWKAKFQNRYEGITSPYYSQALSDTM